MVALPEIRNEVIEIGAPSTLRMEELTASGSWCARLKAAYSDSRDDTVAARLSDHHVTAPIPIMSFGYIRYQAGSVPGRSKSTSVR